MFVFAFYPSMGEDDDFRQQCFVQMHGWLPLFSVWWLSILMNDYCIDGMKELLIIYNSSITLLKSKIFCLIFYMAYLTMFFLILNQKLCFDNRMLQQLILESLMVESIYLTLFYFTQSTGATLLTIVLYCMFINFFDINHFFNAVSVFPIWGEDGVETAKKIYRCVAVVAVSIPWWITSIRKK